MRKVSSDTERLRRGRPARLDRAEGVAVAEPSFHREGYDRLGVATLCDALGVRQPALYRVYGSKAGLFEAVLERYAAGAFGTFVAEEIRQAETPSGLMRGLLIRAADLYAGSPDRLGCLALETASTSADEGARRAAAALVERTRAALSDGFKALGANDAPARADAALLILRGLSTEARLGRSAPALRAAVETLLDG